MTEQLARQQYEAELAEKPNYHDGTPRPAWDQLDEIARWQRGRIAARTELTPAGEQHVIPGCERNNSPRATQLDLFG